MLLPPDEDLPPAPIDHDKMDEWYFVDRDALDFMPSGTSYYRDVVDLDIRLEVKK